MAVFAPWIADFLVRALDLYLTDDFAQRTVEDLTFKYERDNSNLTIETRDPCKFAVYLLKIKKNRAKRVVEAYASDGEVGINTTFVYSTLDWNASKEQFAIGAVFELHNFEIRLADYVEPPRVTLHLREFEIFDKHETVEAQQLISVHEHNLARQYLKKWKTMAGALITARDPDSPTEIRSQVGDQDDESFDGDGGNRSSISVSQTLFATQVPLRYSPKATRSDIQEQAPLKQPIMDETPNKVIAGKNDSLLPSPINGKLPSKTDLESINDVASTAANLTQRQLLVPSSSTAIETPGGDQLQDCGKNAPTEKNSSALSQIPNGLAILVEPMPEAVRQLFRYLREECHDGRYIPRRLQVVPEDQAKLLGSDDCWQPHLVGRAQRLGTVPLDLLNSLTERTDFKMRRAQATNRGSVLTTNQIEEHGNSDQRNQHEESATSSDQESAQLSSDDWPTSPTRRALPPDSSPLSKSTSERLPPENDHGPSVIVNGADVDHTTALDQRTNSGPKDLSGLSLEVQHDLTYNNIATNPSTRNQVLELLPPSTFEHDIQPASSMQHKTIQVKRTPFPNKEMLPVEGIPNSSANIVPGTFDESSAKRTINNDDSAARNISFMNEHFPGHPETTSDTSSMDEENAPVQNQTTKALLETVNTAFISRTGAPDDLESMSPNYRVAVRSKAPTLKRSIDHTWPRQSKRIRHNQNETSELQGRDSDYSVIDEDRIRYRRSFMSRIAKRQDVEEHIASTLIPVSESKKERIQASSSSSTSMDTDQYEISKRHTSPRSNTERVPRLINAQSSDSALSISEEKASTQLYSKFKTVYADYGGQEQNFDASCLLLRRLFLQREATHPSLWDDFVFHHFHDYRDYLLKVIASGDSALPYQEFYSIHVEQPTHLRRIIKPIHIHRRESGSVGNTKRALTATSTSTTASYVEVARRMGSDKLTAADTSTIMDILPNNTHDSKLKRTREYDSTLQVSKDSEESFSISGLQLASRGDGDGGVDEDNESLSRRQEQSHDSQTSVKRWLDRAAGAESPILGTPETSFVYDTDLSVVDPDHEKVASNDPEPNTTVHKKKRTLPWMTSSLGQQGPPPLVPDERTAVNGARKLKVSQPVSKAGNTPRFGLKIDQKAAASSKPTRSAPRCETQESRLPPRTSSKSERPGPRRQDKPETAFARFARFYNDLASEKRASKDLDRMASKPVDMFSWRN